MDEQIKSSQQNVSEKTPAPQPNNNPSSQSKRIYLIVGILLVVLTASLGYVFRNETLFNDNTATPAQTSPMILPTQTQTSEPGKLISTIYEKAQALKSADILIDINPKDDSGRVWWISEDNYNILTPTNTFLLFRSKALNEDFGDNTYASVLSKPGMQQFFDIAITEFQNEGFIKNARNSSTSLTDDKYYDYVLAYEKGPTKCTVTIDPDAGGEVGSTSNTMYFQATIACTDDYEKSYNEQQPFLKALNIHDAVVSTTPRKDGDFYYLNINFRRTGHYSIVKKEGGTYREIASGQDIPPCEKMEAEQVPKSIYGNCFDAKSNTQR